jgi:hypothetical protein
LILDVEKYPINIILKTAAIKNVTIGIINPTSDKIIWVLVNGFGFRSKAEISEIVISFIDVTERKLMKLNC